MPRKITTPRNKAFFTTQAAATREANLIDHNPRRKAKVERITNTRGKGGGYVVTSSARRTTTTRKKPRKGSGGLFGF